MNTQTVKTILVTALITLLLVGFGLFVDKQLDKERIKYANMGAQVVRNNIYLEALEKGVVRVDALFQVEAEEGEEPKDPEIRSIMLYTIINQEE